MITLLSSKKLGGYKIMRNTIKYFEVWMQKLIDPTYTYHVKKHIHYTHKNKGVSFQLLCKIRGIIFFNINQSYYNVLKIIVNGHR